MKAYIGNKIIATATNQLLDYCENKLTIDNPDYIKKERLGLWIGKTPKKIRLYEVRGEDLILPFGCARGIWNLLNKHDKEYDFTGAGIKIEGELPLYDYQEEAVEQAMQYKNGVLVSAAGSGKTQMGIEIIRRIGQKALWITHTSDLLSQSKKRAEQYLKCKMGTITEGKVDIQDITFATVQTMCNLDLDSLKHEFSVVIVDECHRVCSSPTKLTMFGKVINALASRYKIGLTATSHRSDGMIQSMYALLGDIFHVVPASATADKTIKAKIKTINTGFKLDRNSEAIDTDGTIIFAKLINEICFDESRNEFIAEYIKQCRNESVLVLSDRLGQLRDLKAIVGHGVMIDGTMTSKKGKSKREKAIKDMQEGKEKVLYASFNLAKEGLDIPCLTRLILASPKKDYAVIVQSVGRIERKTERKKEAIVYDFLDNLGICNSMYNSRKRVYKKNNNIILD